MVLGKWNMYMYQYIQMGLEYRQHINGINYVVVSRLLVLEVLRITARIREREDTPAGSNIMRQHDIDLNVLNLFLF